MLATQRTFGRDISNVQQPVRAGKENVIRKPQQQTAAIYTTREQENVPPTRRAVAKKTQTHTATTFAEHVYVDEPVPVFEEESEVDELDPMSIDMNNISLDDIDDFDRNDPQFVSEYVSDIFEFLKQKELVQLETIIPGNYITNQRDVSARHRNQLMDWVAECYVQLKLFSETFYLAVNIIDQVLAKGPVPRKKLHLVGVAALFIASKYEETYAPPIGDMVICCNNAFTPQDILEMESLVLNRIGFNLSVPHSLNFLRRYSKASQSDPLTHAMSKFIGEMSCLSYSMVRFLPSQIAATAVLISRQVYGCENLWTTNLKHYSGFQKEELHACHSATLKMLKKAFTRTNPSAIVRKYAEKRFYCVSTIMNRALSR